MRVTSSMNQRQSLVDLMRSNSEYSSLLHEYSSGSRLNKPSDDPAGAVRQLQLRGQLAAQNDTVSRLSDAGDEVTQSEAAVSDAVSIFQRANELCLEAANTSRTDVDFTAIATEADQLLNELVSVGNRKVSGRFLFGGTATDTQPFTPNGSPATSVTYNGNSNTRTVSPSPGLDITVNVPGDQVFTNGTNVFNALIGLRDAANSQDSAALGTTVLTGIDNSLDQLINVRTRIGAMSDTVTNSSKSASQVVTDMETSLSNVEDANIASVAAKITASENAQKAALQALGRTGSMTLLDYLA